MQVELDPTQLTTIIYAIEAKIDYVKDKTAGPDGQSLHDTLEYLNYLTTLRNYLIDVVYQRTEKL